jgi:hypothetical protein
MFWWDASRQLVSSSAVPAYFPIEIPLPRIESLNGGNRLSVAYGSALSATNLTFGYVDRAGNLMITD